MAIRMALYEVRGDDGSLIRRVLCTHQREEGQLKRVCADRGLRCAKIALSDAETAVRYLRADFPVRV